MVPVAVQLCLRKQLANQLNEVFGGAVITGLVSSVVSEVSVVWPVPLQAHKNRLDATDNAKRSEVSFLIPCFFISTPLSKTPFIP